MDQRLYIVTLVLEKPGAYPDFKNHIQVNTSYCLAESRAEAIGLSVTSVMAQWPEHRVATEPYCFEISDIARQFAAGTLVRTDL